MRKRNVIFGFFSLLIFGFVVIYIISNKKTYSISNDETIIYKLSNYGEICNAVKSKKIKIYVEDIDNNSSIVGSDGTSCSNTTYYTANLANVTTSNYEPWVTHYVLNDATTGEIYLEGNKVTTITPYKYFFVSNGHIAFDNNGKLKQSTTLKGGETSSIEINFDSPVEISNYNDLRLSFDYNYAPKSGDINLTEHNSLSVYVYGNNNKKYGPYYVDYQEIEDVVYKDNTKRMIKYNLTSENLLSDISKNVLITKIKIMPYDNYRRHLGAFRLYSLSINGYTGNYRAKKNTVKVSNAESVIRHNLVDKMVEVATIKWDVKDTGKKLEFYAALSNSRLNFPENKVYYGLPYVNTPTPTLQMFISRTQKNSKTANAYYSYILPNKYKKDAVSSCNLEQNPSCRKNIKAGESFTNNTLYLYEGLSLTNDDKTNYISTHDFILNSADYFLGMDCSSSVFSSVGQSLPYVYENAYSNRNWTSNEIYMLGNLSLSQTEVERYLRENNIIGSNDQITVDLITTYYSSVFKAKYGEQNIYKAYAETIPGDIVSSRGHVRMVSGYSYVECVDGIHTNNYTQGFCDSHGGINGNKSYVVTTEISGYAKQSDRKIKSISGQNRFVDETNARWTINLNGNITDLTSINDYLNVYGGFIINNRYYFKELFDGENQRMYMAVRYKALDDVATIGEVVLPKKELLYASDYNTLKIDKVLKGVFITNYTIDVIKYEINGNTYYSYPEQNNIYSFNYDIEETIKNLIANIDYSKPYTLKISVKMGPSVVYGKNGADSDGYVTILSLSSSDSSTIKSSKYIVDGNYVKGINKETTVTNYLNNLSANSYYNIKVIDLNGAQSNSSSLVFTGSLTKVFYNDVEVENFTNIIPGDTTGDGKVTVTDVAKLFQHYRKKSIIPSNQNYYILAGDVVNDNNIKLTDVAKLFQYVRGNISSLC